MDARDAAHSVHPRHRLRGVRQVLPVGARSQYVHKLPFYHVLSGRISSRVCFEQLACCLSFRRCVAVPANPNREYLMSGTSHGKSENSIPKEGKHVPVRLTSVRFCLVHVGCPCYARVIVDVCAWCVYVYVYVCMDVCVVAVHGGGWMCVWSCDPVRRCAAVQGFRSVRTSTSCRRTASRGAFTTPTTRGWRRRSPTSGSQTPKRFGKHTRFPRGTPWVTFDRVLARAHRPSVCVRPLCRTSSRSSALKPTSRLVTCRRTR